MESGSMKIKFTGKKSRANARTDLMKPEYTLPSAEVNYGGGTQG